MKQSTGRFAAYFIKHFGERGRITVAHLDPDYLEALADQFRQMNQRVVWSRTRDSFEIGGTPRLVTVN